jgi:hypothetical protein
MAEAARGSLQFAPRGSAEFAERARGADVVLDSADEDLGADLLRLVDEPRARVLAPVTKHHWAQRPLFLVSIPKSGSHLLYRLAELLGYAPGMVPEDFPRPGCWYFLEYYNSHTVARDFFMDSSFRRAPWSNSHHAFASSPVLFIYRHPLDVLVSEANYFHREDKSVFAGYLSELDFAQRAHRLIDDPWLLGSLRERIGGYTPWLDFPNVVPLSFEELVGAEGGGDAEAQLRLVWSLQLKLQAPGEPHAIAAQLFDRGSPTFFQGRIGGWRSALSPEHLARFQGLEQDFMERFGYDLGPERMPGRAAEFRRRALRLAEPALDKEAVAVAYNHLGFNLVRLAGWVYAVPQCAGPAFDLGREGEERLRLLPRERSVAALKHRLTVESLAWGGDPLALAGELCRQLAGGAPSRRGVRGLLKFAARLLR